MLKQFITQNGTTSRNLTESETCKELKNEFLRNRDAANNLPNWNAVKNVINATFDPQQAAIIIKLARVVFLSARDED